MSKCTESSRDDAAMKHFNCRAGGQKPSVKPSTVAGWPPAATNWPQNVAGWPPAPQVFVVLDQPRDCMSECASTRFNYIGTSQQPGDSRRVTMSCMRDGAD